MKVYVVLKQTFDTEEKIVIRDGAVSEDGVKFVINPYDEYAVEEAIRLKERSGGQVTVVSVGPDRAAEALRTALAMGADEAVLISDDRLSDEYAVSEALAAFLTDQAFDLILGGNFSVDNGAGQVAVRLAELLGIPHVSSIVKLEAPGGGSAVVQRDAEGDLETLDVSLPALFTAQQGLNEPRYPSLPGIMKAKKKPFKRLTADDLGLTADRLEGRTARTSLSLPPVRQAGLILQGDLPQQAAKLVELLRTQSKVL
ncbi:electron transfer flavoprotein subunit beta [Paenibacillus darwinianus]|uniref:Electron transfer flavoprotein subunit beta n=1 Tax=Paenibacillus darwinianus TaxID=1380763 RepID=A0A9W5W7T2_9BACL|nr:electron transfer flavoprotein subunit beta/FixA family protein [Paenibacillus darwinianus]EXX89505.1 electron transfer flavoprotein subunit beta [Paenibacillus darwinianus]EXX90714.1 electron transfer flavoprotein subunit beta [Paenibacillus darwinianus]EXX90926.1 electron transfer flavoprotein subunit beta [Paenibacillus darwinianus]